MIEFEIYKLVVDIDALYHSNRQDEVAIRYKFNKIYDLLNNEIINKAPAESGAEPVQCLTNKGQNTGDTGK
jgi:hypothetical protein